MPQDIKITTTMTY